MKRIFAVCLLVLTLSSCAVQNKAVTLVTHDSFGISDELLKKYEDQTGNKLTLVKAGDAGAMTSKLVLTKDSPIADVVYGIDNTFAPVAMKNNIIAGSLTWIDYADVCFNVDLNYFKKHNLVIPTHWKELTNPKYKDLTVIENPNTSSTGLAFLASTYAYFDSPKIWWQQLKSNGVKVAASWEDAYYTDFSGSAGKGNYPIVLSYSSSPADEVDKNGNPTTVALLKDCFRQNEYAGILKNAKNPIAAQTVIDFMEGNAFQESLPESMYVYPTADVAWPKSWALHAPAAQSTIGEDLDIPANRDQWLAEFNLVFDVAP